MTLTAPVFTIVDIIFALSIGYVLRYVIEGVKNNNGIIHR